MRLKNCEITKIDHSPSGQIVAHVKTDAGHEFLMPFGADTDKLQHIYDTVAAYVDTKYAVAAHAAQLDLQMSPKQKRALWRRFLRRLSGFKES